MLKKTWDRSFGTKEIITKENSTLEMLELTMVKLHPGETASFCEKGKETSLILLGGKCSVKGEGFDYENIGKRMNLFEGAATAVYIPHDTPYTITAVTDVTVAVCKSPSELDCEPVLINPEDVIIKHLGKPGWQREAHFVVDERVTANLIYIGEAFVEGGQWASYPPHKHDEDNMPIEGILEEYYYYEFDKEAGFGIQKVYSKGGDIDETYTVKNGDAVEIPRGYHPFCCAPGYNNYYLWVMAGKNRGFFMTTEEAHKWLNA